MTMTGNPVAVAKGRCEGNRRGPLADESKRQRAADLRAEGMTLAAIGRELGVSRQRVDQFLNPEKQRARVMATKAKERGTIVPAESCESCGRRLRRLFMHHVDYSKPLEVLWLCARCHGKAEGGLGTRRWAASVKKVSRLRSVRERANIAMAELAEMAQVSVGTIAKAECHGVAPRLWQSIRIAHALGVSVEAFASWFVEPKKAEFGYDLTAKSNASHYRRWLSALRIKAGLTQKELARRVGAAKITVTLWESGKNKPHKRFIAPLAAALNVTEDALRSSFVTNAMPSVDKQAA